MAKPRGGTSKKPTQGSRGGKPEPAAPAPTAAVKHRGRKPVEDAPDAELTALIRQVIKEIGNHGTFEEQQERLQEALRRIGRLVEGQLLGAWVVDAPEVEVEGVRYRRLKQRSAGRYAGLFGAHEVVAPIYRAVGLHNGPTLRPLEACAGIVAGSVTPRLARITTRLDAMMTSREVVAVLHEVGLAPPSRAYVENHTNVVASEIADGIDVLEAQIRDDEQPPAKVVAISCGLDRRAIPMEEPRPAGEERPDRRPRREPYVRKPPAPIDVNYRMAFVGTVTAYGASGESLKTWRYGADASADPGALASRLVADVEWLKRSAPGAALGCVQDAGPELRALPEALTRAFPGAQVTRLVDFHHLLEYLGEVVRTCEPAGDPHHMLDWYRSELAYRNDAIDRIFRNLRRRATRLRREETAARIAMAKALRYIRKRRPLMRYAAASELGLPIGSGATESTCKLIGQRTNRSGARWSRPGLQGVIATRALVLSERWQHAWPRYAARLRIEVTIPRGADA